MKHTINMRQIFSGILPVLLTGILLISGMGCAQQAPATTTAAPKTTQATVQRGDLSLVVTVDGNLNMPQAFDLRFGTYGDVREVLVEEGDTVKAGQILARLDDTTQRLDVRLADNGLQRSLSDLYETVPRLPQLPKKLYDADVVTTTITDAPLGVTTTYTIFNFPDTDPMPVGGVTTTTTSTGSSPGTVVITTRVTTITLAPGTADPINTTTVTTNVITTRTTITTTSFIKPDSGYSWDNTLKNWTYNPDALVGPVPTTGYMPRYPNYGVLIPYAWAQSEAAQARDLFSSGHYSVADNELVVALADLEDSIQIIQTAIDDPQSGLGNWAQYVGTDVVDITSLQIQTDQADAIASITALRGLMEDLKQRQADLQKIRTLIGQRKYQEVRQLFDELPGQFADLDTKVLINVRLVAASNDSTIYGKNMCSYLYNAADARLSKAFEAVQKGGMNTVEFQNNLRIAQHQMALCNAILGLNYDVLQHGPLLKEEQQYKINVKNKLVTLGNRQDDFIKTVIMSPFDGIVVKVAVKKNDVLSALDYSSKGTIQVVDTTQIKFLGTVDEIDILKVKRGQLANISVDAIPNKVFTGRVSFISPFGTKDVSNVVKFPVTILLDPSDVTLNGGLTATSRIVISSVKNALLLPPGAVTTSNGESFVNVINPATGQVEKRKVTTGGKNAQFIEITSGLSEGDKVDVEIKVTGAPVTKGFPGRPAAR